MRTYVPPFSSSTLPIYPPTPYVNLRGFTEHHDIIFQNRLIRVCEWLHSCVFRYTFSSIITFPCSYSFDYEFKTWVATSGLPVSQLNYLKIPYRPVALSLPSPHSGRTCCCTPAQATRRTRPETADTACQGGEKLDLTWNSFHSYFMTYIIKP